MMAESDKTASDASAATSRPTGNEAPGGRADWRDRARRPAEGTARGWGGRLLITVATIAALIGLALLVVAPLFSWQTACIAIVLDRHPIGVLAPVPFTSEDVTGLTSALVGRASPATGRTLAVFSDLETSSALRERLFVRMGDLRIRTKDTLLAYVRGQSLVVPPALDDEGREQDDPLAGVPCMIAADLTLRGERPGGLIPCRQLVEALGTAANRTTLVALDLGDLRWDPRLGVVCGMVPNRLEEAFRDAHSRASGDNWILTSHDTLEFSATSPGDRRSLFALALQRGLEGEADADGWGDADGVIELDELARFVTRTTMEWSRQVSGGRHVQRPVVWKLGVGRVALEALPADVAIIRTPRSPVISRLPVLRRLFGGGDVGADRPATPSESPPSAPTAPAASGQAAARDAPPPTATQAGPAATATAGGSEDSAAGSETDAAQPAAAQPQPAAAQPQPAAAQPQPTERDAASPRQAPPSNATADGNAAPTGAATAATPPAASPDAPAAAGQTAAEPGPGSPAAGTPPADAAAAAPQADPPPAAGSAQRPAPASDTAAKAPAAAGAGRPSPRPAPPSDPWQLLAREAERSTALPAGLVDFAPHVWRQAVATVARDEVFASLQTGADARAKADLLDFVRALQTGGRAPDGVSKAADLIARARRTADSRGILKSWNTAPEAERSLATARNDAFELAWALVMTGGRLSGGAGPIIFSPIALQATIDQIAAASDLVTTAGREAEGFDPDGELTTATQALRLRVGTLDDLAQQTLTTIFGSGAAAGSSVFHDLRIVLDSPLPTRETRTRLQRQFTATLMAAPLATPRAPNRRSPRLPSRPRSLDGAARHNVATLAETLVDLYAAGGIATGDPSRRLQLLLPIQDDLRRARESAAALLVELEPQDVDAAMLRLAANLARLLATAAGTVDSKPPSDQDHTHDDQMAGLLRMLDPRDAGVAGESLLAALPRPASGTASSLALALSADTRPAVGVSIPLSATLGTEGIDPTEAEAVFSFDPALVALQVFDGTPIQSGVPLAATSLAWRNGAAEISVTPLAGVGLRAAITAAQVRLLLRSDSRVETAQIALPLPRNRDLVLAVRTAAPMLAAPPGIDGWSRARRPANADDVPTLPLFAWPAGPTSWEMGIENLSGSARTVRVEIHSIASGTAPGDRDAQWQQAVGRLRAGVVTSPPLLVADNVRLPADDEVVAITLVPPTAATKEPSAAADKAPESAGPQTLELPAPSGADQPTPVGPDLAVLIHEASDEQKAVSKAGAATDEGDQDGPALFVSRIRLGVIHPRSLVNAVARYDEQRRQIAVELAPRVVQGPGGLPPGGIVGRLRPLPRDAAVPLRGGVGPTVAVPQVVARKPEVRLTEAGASDVAVAAWNGPDRGTAHFSLDVNGYPRAFTFAVDCSPAADGRAQGPQRDWRAIRIEQPTAARSLIRAPAEAIPMALAVDAPADAFLASGESPGTIAVVLRQIGAGLSGAEAERVAWSAEIDRKIAFTRPPDASGLSLTTTVEDWTFEASGEGLANIDVVAEARLLTAGVGQPVTDSRTFVFDGTPPVIDAPPAIAGVVGRPISIPIRVSDDVTDGFFVPPERIRPGVSGLERVEWAIDLAGTGEPKEWQPAIRREGVQYVVQIDTAKLPQGIRLPLLVRATDKVGLSAPPTRIWLDIAAEPASTKNDLTGRVTLAGRGEAGVPVTISGPAGERTVRSGAQGTFRFTALEPGEYRVLAAGAVRNTMHRAEPATVTVPPAPAPPPSVTLELR
jgi:hypothetical protein